MNYKMIARINAMILLSEAVLMIPALLISVFDGTAVTSRAFLISMGILLGVAALLALLSRGAKRGFYAREGLICVGSGWVSMSLLGCLPFFLSGEIPRYVDALFEMVSGFTTTGASVIPDLTVISRAANYWRCFSHWLGGMGVLVFLLALVPLSSKNEGFTMHILRAESPGPDVGKLVPRMRQTAAVLYLTYIGLTVATFIFLIAGKMPVFDAVCTAFGTAGTGGYGIRPDSIASYSPYLQTVVTVFMLLFGVNFSCYYLLLLRQVKAVLRDEELRLYFGIVIGSIALVAWNIRDLYGSFGETLRHAAFQVSSIITTTGYTTTDFDQWPSFSKAILMMLMLVGACAGSTGGGFKCARLLLMLKSIRRNILQVIQPQKVKVIRVNEKPVSERVVENTNAYLAVYMVILVISTLLISLDGFSTTTNISAVFACFNNIGPGLEAVGPTCSYAGYSVLSKLVLIFDMLAGRLEIFPMLVLMNPRAWKRIH